MNTLTSFVMGQYVPGRSVIHRLDPRSKLVALLVLVFAVFLANSPFTYGFLVAFVFLVILLSRISPGYVLGGLKPVWLLLLLTALLHLFTTKGGDVWVSWGWFTVEEEGVRQALYITLRLALLVLFSSLLTLTTSPMDLTDGMERLMKPIKRFGVPVHEIALMLSIALRFIPTLLEEADKIMKAQMSRGAELDTGSLIKRLRNVTSVIIPLFVSAFRRAEELALAMEARGYRGGEGRTRLRQLRWKTSDSAAVVLSLLIVVWTWWWRI